MRFRLLGPLEGTRDGDSIPLGGPKQRLVLAHLLIRPNEVVSADLLIDEIWGEDPPDAARASLHSYVSHLRKAVGTDRLIGRSPGYLLRVSAEELDALRFEALLGLARRRLTIDPAGAARALREALALWRGEPLADLAHELSLQPEIARLNEMRLGAIEDRIEAELQLGKHGELVPELERLVGRHPLRERLYGHLMLALYRSGRQADALRAYHHLRTALEDELGLDPSPELEALQRQVLNHDTALDLRGEALRGYRILDQLSAGPMGQVHRALEPQTEREVAIKVFAARVANDASFVRRFEADARRVARLEHPHVVPLHDWWREPDAAYLVMRLLRGGSLRERLAGGQVSAADALLWTEQIAGALAAAHRQGVVHGDVRPGNVLLDTDGNAYLADFLVGYDVALIGRNGRADREMRHLAPERRAGGPPSAAADVFGLGGTLADVLEAATLADDGAAPFAVLRRAMSPEPAERFANPAGLAAAIRQALLAPQGDGMAVSPAGPLRSPFKGLRAFEEVDAADFFGRSALIGQLVQRLAEDGPAARLLAVVGPSGSGKSSVVHAGLISALRAGAVAGSEQWLVSRMTPGAWPFEQLERALLAVAVDAPASLSDLLEAGDGLRPAVERVLPEGSDLLLVIDQFEELFTLAPAQHRQRFLDTLAATVDDPAARIRTVITLRADFYDRPLHHERFGRQLAAGTQAVPPLTPGELERAVAGPAERAGLSLEPGLGARIVADMTEQPGGLPLLQYALTELCERREGRRLTLSAYEHSGGIAGAVGRRAEQLVRQLDTAGREAARQVFLRLVEPGEGTEDTARRVRSGDLQALGGDDGGQRGRIEAVVDGFARYRLLLLDRDPETREPTVELAHEALLRAWPRLREWVDEARDDLRNERRLAAATSQWLESGRDPSFLLAGSRLDQAEQWAASTRLLPAPANEEFLVASRAEQRRQEAVEDGRRLREAKIERRALTRLRALVVVLSLGAVLAGGLSILALGESQRAAREARISSARELAAAAVANLEVDPERSIHLALASIEETRAIDGTFLPEGEMALHLAVVGSRAVSTIHDEGGVVDWARTADRRSIFVSSGPEDSGIVTIRDATTGDPLLPSIEAHGLDVNDVALSDDGSLAATAGDDGALRLWQTVDGELAFEVLGSATGSVWGPTFSRDGRLAAAAWPDEDVVRLLDIQNGAVREIAVDAEPWQTAFDPQGRRLAVTRRIGPAIVLDLTTGTELLVLEQDGVSSDRDIQFSPDGAWIASSSGDASVRIWNATDGGLRFVLTGHTGEVLSVDWHDDSQRLMTASLDGSARLWQIGDHGHSQLMVLATAEHPGGVEGVAFEPDGERVMTGDGTVNAVKVWDLGISGDAEWMNLPAGELDWYALDALVDGRIAASSGNGSVTVWDANGAGSATPWSHDLVLGIVGSPTGDLVLSAGFDTVRVWDAATAKMAFTALDGAVRGAAWSRDGEHIALANWLDSGAPIVTILDRTGQDVAVLEGVEGFYFGSLQFGADDLLAVFTAPIGRDDPTSHRVDLWNWRTGEVVRSLPVPPFSGGLTFDPAGHLLATSHAEGFALLTDVQTGDQRQLVGHVGAVSDVAFSPDGARVASAGVDGTARIWDADSGLPELVLRGHTGGVHKVRFTSDGSRLASISFDGTLRVWALDIDDLINIARREVTRALSDEECRQFLHRPCDASD